MALYRNDNINSGLEAVEFVPRPDSNVAFFYTKNPEALKQLKIEIAGLDQEVLGESVVSGKNVLITRGTSTQEEVRAALAGKHEMLELATPKKKFHPWEWRGRFSDIGQGLNFISSFKSGKGLQEDKLAFAGLNLTANWVNKKYGAQKTEDIGHLTYLKSTINDMIKPALPEGVKLPEIDDSRAEMRNEPPKPKSIGRKFDDFMKKNSVRFGEIGLRYAGSIALLLSYPQLKKMGTLENIIKKDVMVNGQKREIEQVVKDFSWKRAWDNIRKQPCSTAYGLLNENKTLRDTGAIYLAGKTFGLAFARTPDPYDTRPKTAFDAFREKYAFRIATVIETGAATRLAAGSFIHKDPLATVGGATVGMGLVSRFFAPFGVKEVDQKELNAHIVDSIALLPPEKRAKILAQVSGFLKEHFKDSPETYGEIFTHLKDKLYHDRGIALYPEPVQQPAEQPAVSVAPKLKVTETDNAMSKSMGIAPEPVIARKNFADDNLRKSRTGISVATHTERVSQPAEATSGIST